MWKNVPAPAIVTRSRSSTGIVLSGMNASTMMCGHPAMSPAKSQPIPPMCVNGKTSALRSSGASSNAAAIVYADAPTVLSVWRAPFGSAVVPDV